MKHERPSSAPRARRTGSRVPQQTPAQPETPAQKAAFTRRVRRAAREVEAAEALREESVAKPPAPAEQPPAPLDAHGFDPADYQWLPVRRRPRKDGWTPQRQQDFIAALADTGCVEHAAQQVDMSPHSCYRLRRSPGAESFSAAWDVALQHAAHRLLDVVFDRAFRGTSEPVFDRDGIQRGVRARQSDRLAMFLLRAYMPERFRHAHRDWRAPDEPLPPPAPPMDDMLRRIAPAIPPEPHRLLPPEDLDDALTIADLLPPGQLPHYLRGRGDAEPVPPVLGPEVEAELERLKRGEGFSDVRPKGWKGSHPGRVLD